MADEDPVIPEDVDELYSAGDFVISLECEEGRVSVAVPSGTDPAVVGRLLDLAVGTIGNLKSQMQ